MSAVLSDDRLITFDGHETDSGIGAQSWARRVRIPRPMGRVAHPSAEIEPHDSPRLKLSVLVCAYNEERNLPNFLGAVLGSKGPSFELLELVCVASGCTDRTVEILREKQREDPRIHVIIQRQRLGKASAVAEGMAVARGDVVLIENADTVPAPGAIEALSAPFQQPEVTLVCSRPVPAPGTKSITDGFARLLWSVHDQVSRLVPKAGEAFALRRLGIPIPSDIEDDDTFLGICAGTMGGKSVYAPDAVVLNRVPASPKEFLRQRYRINRQQMGLWRRKGMITSTWQAKYLLRALANYVQSHPRRIPRVVALMMVETIVRAAALASALVSQSPMRDWVPIESTKWPIEIVAQSGPRRR